MDDIDVNVHDGRKETPDAATRRAVDMCAFVKVSRTPVGFLCLDSKLLFRFGVVTGDLPGRSRKATSTAYSILPHRT